MFTERKGPSGSQQMISVQVAPLFNAIKPAYWVNFCYSHIPTVIGLDLMTAILEGPFTPPNCVLVLHLFLFQLITAIPLA